MAPFVLATETPFHDEYDLCLNIKNVFAICLQVWAIDKDSMKNYDSQKNQE